MATDFEALKRLCARVPESKAMFSGVDMPHIRKGRIEICNEDGTFDVWRRRKKPRALGSIQDGHTVVKMSLSEDEAVEYLLAAKSDEDS